MRRLLGLMIAAGALAMSAGAGAQNRKVPVLGFLLDRSGPGSFDAAFVTGLRERGYIVGQSVKLEYRFTEGQSDRLPAMAADLVARRVDVIVTQGAASTRAAMKATGTIPIVMASSQDAVADGLVGSLARPGGNVTGRTAYAHELTAKRLELLKDAVPGLSRVAVLWNADGVGTEGQVKLAEAAAPALGLTLEMLAVALPDGLDGGMQRAVASGAGAVLILSDSITIMYRREISAAALRHRLPTMFSTKAYIQDSGLMSYGPDIIDMFRQTAVQVDKILKGANPASLPVEQPAKFELVINMQTAKALNFRFSRIFLERVDALIE